ncbi:hypothetical protein [Sinorhizobium sp. RAC02]|uniref:hypothetical protein n=1 Tax=Sinorhizobium sp. RAC02 TaxID=1842534 RepID=UPI00083E4970|nr:hypothetical protein [Sinorhizobium sp. RAC02]
MMFNRADWRMLLFIEAMHLLPQGFELQTVPSSSQERLQERRHSSSQSLFGSFRKACRTSSRGRLFRFRDGLPSHQHRALLVIRRHRGRAAMVVGKLARRRLIAHRSATALVAAKPAGLRL